MKYSFYELIIFFLAFQLVLFSQQSTINKPFSSLESIYSNSLIYTNRNYSENSSWVEQNSGTIEDLNDVVMIDSLTAIVVGNYSSILKTTDAGETWRNTAPQVDCAPGTDCVFNLNSIQFFDKMNGIVAGESVLLITSDGGEEWHFLPEPSFNNFTCISNLLLDNIFVGDDSGYIYNSRDTGKTWASEKISDLSVQSIYSFRGDIESFAIYDPLIFALTPNSLFIKKAYSSEPWKEWSSTGFPGINSLIFDGGFSENGIHFIVGESGQFVPNPLILRLGLPDSHWYDVSPENEIGSIYSFTAPSSEILYVCGNFGKIYKSINEGKYWFLLSAPTIQKLNSIYFFNNKRGFAVGDSGTILYTKTGGISEENNPPSPFNLLEPENETTISVPRSIEFKWHAANDPDGDSVYYTVLISSDTGATWTSYGPVVNTTELQVQSPAMNPGRYFWTVIANDGILSTPSLDVFAFNIVIFSGNEEDKKTIPDDFVLFQNYPNPFNPTTRIRFSIKEYSHVSLIIYDILGNEIATLINEDKPSGQFEVDFNGSSLASGLYYYKINAGNFSETKKMIILK